MTTGGRLSNLWTVPGLVVTCLVLHACSTDERPLTPAGPASPFSPAAPGVVVRGTVTDERDGPIAGAFVSGPTVSAMTDATGAFTGAYTGGGTREFLLYAHKVGYVSRSRAVSPHGDESVTIKLATIFPLPIDGATAAELLPADLPASAGEPYDSEYLWNAKHFSFTTPGTHDVIVEMPWEPTGNAALAMWALDGRLSSLPSGNPSVLRLPRGSSGLLLVGQPYSAGQLTRPVAFELHTRRADP